MDSSLFRRLQTQFPRWQLRRWWIVDRLPRWTKIGFAILLGLVLATVAASFFLDEPLRRRMEANLNAALKGYSVRLGKLDFHPIGLSLDLEDLIIHQNGNPEPPVAQIPKLAASVDWRAICAGESWRLS